MMMGSRPDDGALHPRVWLVMVMVTVAVGWFALAGCYLVVRSVFGVLSVVTFAAVGMCWLWVIGLPVGAAVASARRGSLRWSALFGGLVAVSGLMLWTVGLPRLTPEGLFRQHRDDLAVLASDFRAGRIGDNAQLPWRLRLLSIDGRAHSRCEFTDPGTGERQCALYLPTWQDWRGESGEGLVYFPAPPGPDTWITTAPGDAGHPVRDLGDGWWWVD